MASANDHGPWRTPAWSDLARLLVPLPRWWVAGGWAIDSFVGFHTREHKDVDVAVLRGHQAQLARALEGWDVHVAHDGTLTPWDRRPLPPERHQLWARPATTAPWTLELLLEDHDGDARWLFRRNRDVTLPLAQLGRVHAGLPYLAPEVALLYKAKSADADERGDADFASASRYLDDDAKRWLARALAIAHPGHRWLAHLPR